MPGGPLGGSGALALCLGGMGGLSAAMLAQGWLLPKW
jgi:hypothetical protein